MNKRDEIAKRVLDSIGNRPASQDMPDSPRKPRTYMGLVGEQMTQSIGAKVEALEKERREGGVLISVDPKRIRSPAHPGRHNLSLTVEDEDLVVLKESMARNGQLVPVAVREVKGDPSVDYEIVVGRRRHAAALVLDSELKEGFKLKAIVDTAAADPRVLAMHVYIENARKDPSPYEIGSMFCAWIDEGIFKDAQEIAMETGVSKSSVFRYISLARIPKEIIEAFGDPRQISARWADDLSSAIAKNKVAAIKAAKAILVSKTPCSANQVFKAISGSGEVRGSEKSKSAEVEKVKISGKTAVSYSRKNDHSFGIKFGKWVEPDLARSLTEEIKKLLNERLSENLKT